MVFSLAPAAKSSTPSPSTATAALLPCFARFSARMSSSSSSSDQLELDPDSLLLLPVSSPRPVCDRGTASLSRFVVPFAFEAMSSSSSGSSVVELECGKLPRSSRCARALHLSTTPTCVETCFTTRRAAWYSVDHPDARFANVGDPPFDLAQPPLAGRIESLGAGSSPMAFEQSRTTDDGLAASTGQWRGSCCSSNQGSR